MQIKPVPSYTKPGYPIRPEVDARPDILRLLPKRWQANPTVVAALTACIALANCGKSAAQDSPSRVAPVFIHGGGIGAFGCMVANPPVFLSEDEARKVIVDEAKRAGISFAPDSKTVEGVQLPTLERRAVNPGTRTDASGNKLHSFQTKTDASGNKLHSFQAKPVKVTKARPIVLDGFDRKRDIAFEYVSSQDFNDWKMSERISSVHSYDLRDAADKLRNAIAQTGAAGTYGVFYDPLVRSDCVAKPAGSRAGFKVPGTDWQAGRTNSRAVELDLAHEELRAQVKDFIKWLKAQGVI